MRFSGRSHDSLTVSDWIRWLTERIAVCRVAKRILLAKVERCLSFSFSLFSFSLSLFLFLFLWEANTSLRVATLRRNFDVEDLI
ncbi:hypothetical protein IscW_ISCW007837 [Ixodes scapularis]|uniref:Uncharacterized protein n=1 Tax=Ixodes scapularis TaxID=6945 RepID=B7PT96_IXOSC|nr:hypothetical protein IscW_ISCW007837 [Ixodes scapularis]|eukprot:XP_002404037.1 hypothetical protein IscW_ISCW007837 [Ixodes scapularis]